MGKLTAVGVRALSKPGRYRADPTLYLNVAPGGSKSWIQRIAVNGRRRDIGLGAWPPVTLARLEIRRSRIVGSYAGAVTRSLTSNGPRRRRFARPHSRRTRPTARGGAAPRPPRIGRSNSSGTRSPSSAIDALTPSAERTCCVSSRRYGPPTRTSRASCAVASAPSWRGHKLTISLSTTRPARDRRRAPRDAGRRGALSGPPARGRCGSTQHH